MNLYMRLLESNPLMTKCVTSSILLGYANFQSQKIQKVSKINWDDVRMFGTRSRSRITFATHEIENHTFTTHTHTQTAIWGPIVSSLNHFWQQILVKYGPASFFRKIAVDHICWKIPILFVFFAYTDMYKGKSFREALKKAWNLSASSVQLTSLKVWPAVQTINFYFVPLSLRVLYMNVSLVFWTIFLAIFMRKKKLKEKRN